MRFSALYNDNAYIKRMYEYW